RDGTLCAGDAAGVRIQPGRQVLPVSPPPDIDVEAWDATIDEIERRAPERLALVHFGVADDVGAHLEQLRRRLHLWAGRVVGGMDEPDFVAPLRRELVAVEGGDAAELWQKAAPLAESYHGVKRYWAKKAAAAAGL